MDDRLKALRRLEAVQKQMVRLSECRLAIADKARRELEADQTRLRDYLAEESSIGLPLAKAALKSIHAIERRQGLILEERDVETRKRDASLRREHLVASMITNESALVRRAGEDRALAQTMEAWLAAEGDASLP